MSLPVFQEIILKLYTQEDFLDVFSKDPESFLKSSDLTEREMRAISSISPQTLYYFHQSLWHKRKSIIQKILARRKDSLIASSFSNEGPQLYFDNGKGIETLSISENIYRALETLFQRQKVLSIGHLARIYIQGDITLSPTDFFMLVYRSKKNNFQDKELFIL